MLDGDTDTLDDLLADNCTLTHITGYEQPKKEWLSQMRAGQFVYHGVDQKNLTVEADGDTARVSGRIVTDATVYGTRSDWRLRMTLDYALQNRTWTVIHSAATTW